MSLNLYIARQPILDCNKNMFAYELLYRDSNLTSEITNDRHATVTVLSNVLNKFGVKNLLGNYKAFIKADRKFLTHEVVFTIPHEHFIFALQPSMILDEQLVERITQLHEMGYVLAINDTIFDKDVLNNFSEVLKYISYIKVDAKTPTKNLKVLQDYNVKIIFTKVETHDMYERLLKYGCEYVQGYFFSKPKILQQEKFDPDNLKVIKLCNFIMDDNSIDEIVEEFQNNHAVSIQLLKFVNSGSFHFRHHLSSIRQILTLMGRTPLSQWLMLMVFSTSGSDSSEYQETPLVTLVKNRTNLMVAVSKQIIKDNSNDISSKVYLVGVLSLMDTLFSVDMKKILNELNIDDEIKVALLNGEGLLGEIYEFAKDLENFNIEKIEKFSNKYSIDMQVLEKLTFESIQSATNFEESKA